MDIKNKFTFKNIIIKLYNNSYMRLNISLLYSLTLDE